MRVHRVNRLLADTPPTCVPWAILPSHFLYEIAGMSFPASPVTSTLSSVLAGSAPLPYPYSWGEHARSHSRRPPTPIVGEIQVELWFRGGVQAVRGPGFARTLSYARLPQHVSYDGSCVTIPKPAQLNNHPQLVARSKYHSPPHS